MKALLLIATIGLIGAAPELANMDAKAADTAIAQYLVSDSLSEIALCRLALQKTANPAVRTFAQKMIADHTTAIAQTVALAKAQNLGPLDMKPSEEGVVERDHLARYDGHMFDENFLELNREDHASDIETVRHEAEITQNPAVKSYDDAQLALLESHLTIVEQTRDQVAQSQ